MPLSSTIIINEYYKFSEDLSSKSKIYLEQRMGLDDKNERP